MGMSIQASGKTMGEEELDLFQKHTDVMGKQKVFWSEKTRGERQVSESGLRGPLGYEKECGSSSKCNEKPLEDLKQERHMI